ncbi:winged helix-turn-helix transcriptional regulator [Salarchaeum sp. JOR-1]|uniref:winged helix-turn-helix transcriptional regulator n=1 Tax=Salarchaeum sp. JOR-1 TaxID=2599399 RepID=UPI0011987827|nr:winged helix-turn-helix transcriptional regulator [Salarchaeum sp. JOR-1]QDX39454.1 MarR family transcriptional regulator [Salarchaeum sp. JOR-1]
MTTRTQIADRIAADPGIHFNALVRELDLAPGQVQYHVQRLLRAGTLVEESLYGRTHYYPPEYDAFERRALALARRENSRDILFALLDGDRRASALADELALARSTLSYHVSRLVAVGLVEKHKDAQQRVELTLTDPDRTARILADIEPSLPERLVDRLERLLDSVFEP